MINLRERLIRKSNRLKGYDYSLAADYFITICSNKRHELFSFVGAAFCRPIYTEIGTIIQNEIDSPANVYTGISVIKYVIMPNHLHMIIIIDSLGRQNAAPTIKCGFSVWQKSFYDSREQHMKYALQNHLLSMKKTPMRIDKSISSEFHIF